MPSLTKKAWPLAHGLHATSEYSRSGRLGNRPMFLMASLRGGDQPERVPEQQLAHVIPNCAEVGESGDRSPCFRRGKRQRLLHKPDVEHFSGQRTAVARSLHRAQAFVKASEDRGGSCRERFGTLHVRQIDVPATVPRRTGTRDGPDVITTTEGAWSKLVKELGVCPKSG